MKPFKIISLCILLAMVSACKSSRDHVYLQDMQPGLTYKFTGRPDAEAQPDDRLDIRISCNVPEAAAPFNIQGDLAAQGYTVDNEGDITMPIIGVIRVAGLTAPQIASVVRKRLITGGFINDPIVNVRFLNIHYTVLGAVGGNGQYTVDGERITLLEAIARAGDLTSEAMPDRVYVIREEHDGRKMYVHDVRSTDVFNSPAFYLQQNDIVYAQPKHKADSRSEARAWQFATLGISIASVICTIIWATK